MPTSNSCGRRSSQCPERFVSEARSVRRDVRAVSNQRRLVDMQRDAISGAAIYAARARHSAKAAERLCL
jgi:hypothetical protein